MKNLKTRARPSPAEALAVAAQTAPSQPPAQMEMSDRATTLNLRLRETSINAITMTARDRGLTIKQLVAHALAEAGVAIAPADLEDRTPRRGKGASHRSAIQMPTSSRNAVA
jgi:hypothetical protein